MTPERMVGCAWCGAAMRVSAPNVGKEGYFLLPRQCRHCAGNNLVELAGTQVQVRQLRRGRRRSSITQKLHLLRAIGR
jgi:hypothetical protein